MDIKKMDQQLRRKISGKRCDKCKGYMIYDIFYDSETGESHRGWKCINCGEIVDQTILQNRPFWHTD